MIDGMKLAEILMIAAHMEPEGEDEMSRQYDAKHEALKAYPEDREAGVDLFMTILDISDEDFRYSEGMSPEEYVYGKGKDED